MIPSTVTFAEAVEGVGRTFRAKVMHDDSEIQCSIIEIKLTKGACDGETFSVGSVFSSHAEIILNGLSIPLENEDITLKIGVLNANDEYEYIDYAKYTVIKAKRSGAMTTVTAVGFIASKMNVPLPNMTAPTIQAVATAIYNTTGVPVSFVGISSGLSNTLAKGLSGMTCRGALEIISFLVGGFATENNAGGVEIHKFAIPQSPVVLPQGRSLSEPISADDTFNMTGVKVIVGQDYILSADTTVDDEKTYYTRSGSGTSADPYVYTEVEEPTGNPHTKGYYELAEKSYSSGTPIRQTYQSEYMSASAFNVFAANVIGYQFMPASVDMSLGDPRLEPWDVLSVTDFNDDTFNVPCHLIESYFDGGFSSQIVSTGESQTEPAVEGSITKQVGEMSGQLAVTQQAATLAKAAASSAKASADEAKAQALTATNYANEAKTQAQQAQTQAQTATTYANEAKAQAQTAEDHADEARVQAVNANKYAHGALDQLSVVQDVIGVLTWASEHGTFTRTTDTTIQDGKVYFTYDSTTGDYTPVVVPQASALSTYYELTVDEAMQSFIMAHLAVTSRGLWVLPSGLPSTNKTIDNNIDKASSSDTQAQKQANANARQANDYKVLLSNDGMHVYDSAGVEVSVFGENIKFNATREQYIGNNNAYIVFDPDNNGSITIGGSNITLGSNKTLSEVLNAAEIAENTFIYDHDYTYVNGAYTFTAYLYQGGEDVKSQYDPTQFTWWYKTEDGASPIPLANNLINNNYESYGYTITISDSTPITIDDFGYGGHVIGHFITSDDSELLNENDDNLTNTEGQNYTARTQSGESVRVSDLTVSTTLYPTDKLMIIGAEDEHLATIQTLQDYLNLHLDKQVLFDTSANWNAQTTLVSQADTLYVYTDHHTDSDRNPVAGIKIGDGNAYVVDLPFIDAIAMEHINDTVRHITSEERIFWNNKVRCYYTGVENLVFTTA